MPFDLNGPFAMGCRLRLPVYEKRYLDVPEAAQEYQQTCDRIKFLIDGTKHHFFLWFFQNLQIHQYGLRHPLLPEKPGCALNR
jgi:hypothetical protein